MELAVSDEIRDHKIQIKRAKESHRWIKSVNRRFWLTQHIFRNRPIRVNEWSDFDSGKTAYLDIQIELPPLPSDLIWNIKNYLNWILEFRKLPRPTKNFLPGFHCRWVFTVLSRHAWFSEMSTEDAHSKLYHGKSELHNSGFVVKGYDTFGNQLRDNLDIWLESGPIVEFDNVYTSQEFFTKDDVIKHTKLWIERWYPKLASRRIEWAEDN